MSERHLHIVVPPGKNPERIDLYLTHHVENASRSKVQQAIVAGAVLVNGKQVKPSYHVTGGESIDITLSAPPPPDVYPENIPLDILYEDESLIVINKPAGMVTHPAFGHYTGTLVNALLFHCHEKLFTVNDPTRPGIVHRLDKDTSGLIVVAKNDAVHTNLARQFSEHSIDREYWALVWGRFKGKEKKNGIIDAALGRSAGDRKKITVRETGKHAVTMYEVIEEYPFLTLLRLKLLTGRTHQIRVHLHHIGHPVFGDPTYGGRRIAWGDTGKKKKELVQRLLKIIPRQALHAKILGFVHPRTRQKMKFDSELPDDMKSLLRILNDEVRES